MRSLTGLGALAALACLLHMEECSAGTLEARYADVVLRLGQSDTSRASRRILTAQRAQALAFEARWQAATWLLLRSLELRSSAGSPFRAQPLGLGAPLASQVASPGSSGQASRPPWVVLERYRMPSLNPAAVPPGCRPLAACIESVATYGNRALDLWSPAKPLEESARLALDGLERALECSAHASSRKQLWMGPTLELSAEEPRGREVSLAARWWVADSLERLLLAEGGATAVEIETYANWIAHGGLPQPHLEDPPSDPWATARALVHGYLPPATLPGQSLGHGGWRDAARSAVEGPGQAVEVEWFDILGRRVWSSVAAWRRQGASGDPARTLPAGIYFVRERRRDSTRSTRVIVRE